MAPPVVLLAGLVLALWRCPRDPAGFAAGLAMTFLPFIAFNKQAFANYYYFVIGALATAVAASGILLAPYGEPPRETRAAAPEARNPKHEIRNKMKGPKKKY